MKNRDNIKPIYVLVRPATAEFLKQAAVKSKTSVSDMARDAVIASAERAMGKKAPEVQPFNQGGATGLFSQAAAKAGLTVEQLKSKLATEALGGTWNPPAAKVAKKNGKKAKK